MPYAQSPRGSQSLADLLVRAIGVPRGRSLREAVQVTRPMDTFEGGSLPVTFEGGRSGESISR